MTKVATKSNLQIDRTKFTVAKFVNWSPGRCNYSIFIDAAGTAYKAPLPAYHKSQLILCRRPANSLQSAFIERWHGPFLAPQAVGLLRVRDLRNLITSGALQTDIPTWLLESTAKRLMYKTKKRLKSAPKMAITSFCLPPFAQMSGDQVWPKPLPPLQLFTVPFNASTAIELIELASGETFVRKQTPKKQIALNDSYKQDFEAEKAKIAAEIVGTVPDELAQQISAQSKREKNLKRYNQGDKMTSKGISSTGMRKIRLFGRALQNQAYVSNFAARARKWAYGSHITLTLPGAYPQKLVTVDDLDQETGEITTETKVVPDYAVIKKMFRRFIDAFAYYVERDNPGRSAQMQYAWVIEEQERGAPHYHIMFGHFAPMDKLKALWANQVNNWRIENNYSKLTDNETNAIVTVKGVRSFSNYLTKYFLKQDMQVPGQCWGLSDAANRLIEPNKSVPTVYFERAADAYQVIAKVATKAAGMVSSKGKKLTATFTNLAQSAKGYLPFLAAREPKYKPPSLWLSNPKAAYSLFDAVLGDVFEALELTLAKPLSAYKGDREAVPLYDVV